MNCELGEHGVLVDDAAQPFEDCVNVEHRCPACQTVVTETSWTRAAWDAAHKQDVLPLEAS